MRGAFPPPAPPHRGEMITEFGVNVGRKIYPIASPQCTGYPDDGGVRPTLRFETPPALKKGEERGAEGNEGKGERARERGREKEKERG